MKIKLFIVILISVLICSVLYPENVNKENTYTPIEFMQVLKEANNCLSILRPALENMRLKAIKGSNGVLSDSKREITCEEIRKLCERSIKCFKQAGYKGKTVFYTEDKPFRTYNVLMIEPETTEKFIIRDPLIYKNENILQVVIKKNIPAPISMNAIIGLIDRAWMQHRKISVIMKAYQIRMEGALIFKELTTSLNRKISANPDHKILRNINKASWFYESAERFLQKYQNYLYRVRELSIQTSNGIYTEEDRDDMYIEMTALIQNCRFYIRHARHNGIPVFYDLNQPYKEYSILLRKSEPKKQFRIYSPQIVDNKDILSSITNCGIRTPDNANKAISIVDLALENVSYIRSQIGAFYNRLEYACIYQKILLHTTNKNKTEKEKIIKSHLKSLELRLNELTIQAANGIYTDSDRKQIDFEYQELIEELQCLQEQTGYKHAFSGIKKASVLTQKSAEKVMLRLSKIFSE